MAKQLHFRLPGKSQHGHIQWFLLIFPACTEILSIFVSEAWSQKSRELAELHKDLWEEGKTQTIMDTTEYLTAAPAGYHPFSHWKHAVAS